MLREKRGVFGSLAAISKITQSILTECQVVIGITYRQDGYTDNVSLSTVVRPVASGPPIIN